MIVYDVVLPCKSVLSGVINLLPQVLKAKFSLCQYIAKTMRSFSKRSAFYALDGLVDKIGDIKVTCYYFSY